MAMSWFEADDAPHGVSNTDATSTELRPDSADCDEPASEIERSDNRDPASEMKQAQDSVAKLSRQVDEVRRQIDVAHVHETDPQRYGKAVKALQGRIIQLYKNRQKLEEKQTKKQKQKEAVRTKKKKRLDGATAHSNSRTGSKQKADKAKGRVSRQRTIEQPRTVCRFYSNGNCRFGDKCKNRHAINNMGNSMKSDSRGQAERTDRTKTPGGPNRTEQQIRESMIKRRRVSDGADFNRNHKKGRGAQESTMEMRMNNSK